MSPTKAVEEKKPPASKKLLRKKATHPKTLGRDALQARVDEVQTLADAQMAKVIQLSQYIDQLKYTVTELQKREEELSEMHARASELAIAATRKLEACQAYDEAVRKQAESFSAISARPSRAVNANVLNEDPRQHPNYGKFARGGPGFGTAAPFPTMAPPQQN